MYKLKKICNAVYSVLADEEIANPLRQKQYRDKPLPAGCCYIASEAIYHLNALVGPHHTLQPFRMMHEGVAHWFLFDCDVTESPVIDITASQFETLPFYDFAKKRHFLTRLPSRRACVVIAYATVILEHSRSVALTSSK